MRPFAPLLIALISALACFNANATTQSSDPCAALDWHDIESLGATKDTSLVQAGWHQEDPIAQLPEAKLFTNLCAAVMKSPEGRISVTLGFDSIQGKASVQQVSDWLKAADAADTMDGISEMKTVKFGETRCENGRYDLPTKNDTDDTISTVVEYYVACDQQVGKQHLALNIHVPEGKKAVLPTVEQTKAMLDKLVARIKKSAISAPAK